MGSKGAGSREQGAGVQIHPQGFAVSLSRTEWGFNKGETEQRGFRPSWARLLPPNRRGNSLPPCPLHPSPLPLVKRLFRERERRPTLVGGIIVEVLT